MGLLFGRMNAGDVGCAGMCVNMSCSALTGQMEEFGM